ncbi:MAG: hypothetical protein IV100_33210 [Myxococcales bacterium]|nr:hypothetical protein [Myxococcales bacterium]
MAPRAEAVHAALRRVLARDPALLWALDGPDPLRTQSVPALAWNGRVTLWWIAAGPLTRPTLRYVALWDEGAGHLDGVALTDDIGAFERATRAAISVPESPPPLDSGRARQLGLLAIETTRPLDRVVSLLTPESAIDDGPLRTVTELVFHDPRGARQRSDLLIRLTGLPRDAAPDVVSALLESESNSIRPHALPAACLDSDARHQLEKTLTERVHALELETGATLGEAWPTLRVTSSTPTHEGAPFGATSLSLEERRTAVENFIERRESPRVYAMGDRVRFQALVAVGEAPGLLELTLWRDGRVRSSWTWLPG